MGTRHFQPVLSMGTRQMQPKNFAARTYW